MEKLGKFLVKKYVITEYELGRALELQKETGSALQQILLAEGYTNSYKLYSAIAEYEEVEFADLSKNPCDTSLLSSVQAEQYLALGLVPWKKDGDVVVIAASDINDEAEYWATKHYGEHYRFVITSPFDIDLAINTHFAKENDADAREKLWRQHPEHSARDLFGGMQSKIFLLVLAALIGVMVICPYSALAYGFLVVNVFYGATLLFKGVLFVAGMLRAGRLAAEDVAWDRFDEKDLPVYTILVPLYREEKTLLKLVKAIRALDYPRSKLDVKLVVEEDDSVTIEAIKALKCERMFQIVRVAESIPRTKPKACNYALKFAKGQYVTIYDAEDIPEPQQLKKVLHAFMNGPEEMVCVQAKLNYFNREENLLTRMFAIEYSTLFDFILHGLVALGVPVPLGGTSNHFRIKALQELYAWDPYNVTEDADLGIRLVQKGWHVGLVDSLTLEEAPITLKAWIRQRSRWIKGHMQTYFVHMRHPFKLFSAVGMVGFMGFQLFMGAPALIFLISPFMWGIWALFMFDIVPVGVQFPHWFDTMIHISFGVLFAGIVLQMFCAVVSIRANKWPKMFRYVFFFPFYWLLHSVASFKSLWQLITRPHYWEKTSHGETSFRLEDTEQA